MKVVSVIVEWTEKKALNLPVGKQYITVAKFLEDVDWINEAWSIVLEFDKSPKQQGNPSKGKAHFLIAKAPQERLAEGKIFELYEGSEKTATVYVRR
jgi:hypothetical protein